MKFHTYNTKVEWTGNEGSGTSNYKSYNRNHLISIKGKSMIIDGSSDPAFMGDKSRYNPEDLFLSSLSSCHMLCYLHLCSTHKIIVTEYVDAAKGVMEETDNGSGKFVTVVLNPAIKITDITKVEKAIELHEKANELCFIANSCNFEIEHNPIISVI